MKIHELANQLELFAKLLRTLPDAELEDTITEPTSIIERQKKGFKASTRASHSLPLQAAARLKKMTPAEIEKYLSSDDEEFSNAQLQDLAAQLGISTSKRQSKSALVNLITRHFEAIQMDSIIRSSKKEES